MHGGTLVVEDETENLLRRFGCITLEEVFLKICSSSPALEGTKTDDTSGGCDSERVWIPMVNVDRSDKRLSSISNMADIANNNNPKVSSFKLMDFCIRLFILKAIMTKTALNFLRFPGCVTFPYEKQSIQKSVFLILKIASFGDK